MVRLRFFQLVGGVRGTTALAQRVGAAQAAAGSPVAPWVIVNDVAGFIGPELFRTREQLVRCCLEDLVMGKLHGLTMGLDVCATLHMDISLDDLDWCLDRLLPACPAYLMALPTKIDPMLGYLTMGFQDHVRLRARAGATVNPPMQRFFTALGVMDDEGQPGPHFGDPLAVFSAYLQRQGDTRTDAELRTEGERQLADVRARGVLVAEGCGATPDALAPELEREVRRIHDEAKLAFWAELPEHVLDAVPSARRLETQSGSREEYILHPVTGEALSRRSRQAVEALRAIHANACDLQIVVSDGLNALAIAEPGQLLPFLETLRDECAANGWHASVETLVIRAGRVRAGYRAGPPCGGRAGSAGIADAAVSAVHATRTVHQSAGVRSALGTARGVLATVSRARLSHHADRVHPRSGRHGAQHRHGAAQAGGDWH
jgi:ethanolamine ammonia-lyase large subunit